MSETKRSSGTDGPDPGTSRGKSRGVRAWCLYLATTIGLFCLMGRWGLGGAVTGVVVALTAGAVTALAIWGVEGRREVRRIARVTLATGLMAPAAVGLIGVFNVAGVLVVLALAATTPALTSRIPRRQAAGDSPVDQPEPAARRAPETSLADGPAAAPASELSSLGNEALCLAWRRSFRLLEAAASAAERLAVVEQRQQYLDEFQRRCPDGLAAWLASGARASSNPLPFLGDARRRAD